jgi:hypothetical protein
MYSYVRNFSYVYSYVENSAVRLGCNIMTWTEYLVLLETSVILTD